MPQNTRECRRNCTGQNQNGATSLEDWNRQHSPTHQPATQQKNHRASGPRILQPSSGGRHLAHAGASGNRIQKLYNSKCITEGSKAHRCQWLEKPSVLRHHLHQLRPAQSPKPSGQKRLPRSCLCGRSLAAAAASRLPVQTSV